MSEELEKIDVKEIEQKVYRTDYIDGLAFIFLGIVLFITAGIIKVNLAFMGLLTFSFFICFLISEALRKRYTYPRLGYFKIKTDNPSQVVGVILFISGLIVISLVIILILEGGKIDDISEIFWKYLPMIFGLILSGPSLDIADKTGQTRYYGIGIFSTLFGLLIVLFDFPNLEDGITLYLLILGTISIIIGIITFIRFVKKYPIITDTDNNDDKESKKAEIE